MPKYVEPVFIVGMPRSGTTLIQGILCHTGRYFPIPETHFFARATHRIRKKVLSQKDRKLIEKKLLKKSRITLKNNIPDNLTSEKDVFEYVIDQFNINGNRSFLEKTPRHIFYFSKIFDYYPDAKFILMIREPKNMVTSQLTNSPKNKKSLIRLSFLYNKISSEILKIKDIKNVFLMRYEDLTNEPEKTLRQLFEFLNIAFDPIILENVTAPDAIVSEHEFWKKRNLYIDKIKKNDPDKWQKYIDSYQADLINFITGSHAAKFGYNLFYSRQGILIGILKDIKNLFLNGELLKLFSEKHG